MTPYQKFLKESAKRNAKIRWWVLDIKISKSAAARKFGISRERVRQIVSGK